MTINHPNSNIAAFAVDDCIFFDNSLMSLITMCPRKAYYSTILKRRGLKAPALTFGTNIHHALDARYRSLHYDMITPDLEGLMLDKLTEAFEKEPTPVGDRHSLDLATSMIRVYNQKYPIEGFTVLHLDSGEPFVELPFAYEIDKIRILNQQYRLIYCGKLDVGVKEDNMLFTLDHKTTSIMSDGFFLDQNMSAQHEGYIWAANKAFPNHRFVGTIVNVLRKPDARRKVQECTLEDFGRLQMYKSQDQINEWLENTLFNIKEFIHYCVTDFFPARKEMTCVHKYGKCDYLQVCEMPRESRMLMLSSGEYEENTWSPLKQKEEKDSTDDNTGND